jgi:hypothetical protein
MFFTFCQVCLKKMRGYAGDVAMKEFIKAYAASSKFKLARAMYSE